MAATCPCRLIAPETAAARLLGVLWFVSVTTGPWGAAAGGGEETLKSPHGVQCFPAPNITCKDFGGNKTHFTGNEVAVALSLFLGWLGADRFYLGYPALGLLKFCTVGFCGIGSLIDFILISMQIIVSTRITSWQIDGKQWKQCQTLFFWAPKSLQMVVAAMKLKDTYSLEGKL
ncbi:hypothetical protein FD754_019667 [Muntiacus muntjak]|uniref:TM2 domain-containing protein n=1 Tax=Muntiacus muntjak TaxID=9888 RepID=A0A5N3V2P3_MUNMU|nr:hypothetical protein FD754_019667 [Muntiacus muntjak]